MKNAAEKNKRITEFWKWFGLHQKLIREVLDDELHPEKSFVVENLDNYVLGFGVFSWEIGLTDSKNMYFSISPNGNPELLLTSKEIIKEAPAIDAWEFFYAKPPKKWDFKFTLYDNNMLERFVDASAWKFVLLDEPGKARTFIIEAKNIEHLDDDTKDSACDLILTNTIGEERKIHFLNHIDFVGELEETHRINALPIELLAAKFKS